MSLIFAKPIAAGLLGPSSSIDQGVLRFDGTTGLLVQDSLVYIDDSGNMGLNNIAPCSILELWDDDAHPILSITAAHNTDYDPQIQLRTDATDTVKCSLGVDASDDSLRINMGSGVGGATHFIMDTNGGVKWQNSTDSTTAYQWLDADGGTPILNIDSTNERVGVGESSPAAAIELTKTEPYFIFHNSTPEDTDGGRESKLLFKGEQSGDEETTLASIVVAHEGSSDDEKGYITFFTNDGSDGDTPTERVKIDSEGKIQIYNSGQSVFIGENAGRDDDLSNNRNVFIGYRTGEVNTTGANNVAIGYATFLKNTTGFENFALGNLCLGKNTQGLRNTGLGYNVLAEQTTADYNTGIGWQAGRLITGEKNIYIGAMAGGTNSETGDNNILIGYYIDAPVTAGSNQLSIGNLLFSQGIDGTGTTVSSGNLGICEPAPAAAIELTKEEPYFIFHNPTEEDGDGGRESKLLFKGEQSGGEETTLASIVIAHDGAADDQKGYVQVATNDGTDDDAPTLRMEIDSAGNSKFGDGGVTNYVNIGSGGDVNFIGGAGLCFGSCYVYESGWQQANAVQNTWYNVSDADFNDGQLHNVTHDGSGKLTVTNAGMYLANVSADVINSVANDHMEIGFEISGSGSANSEGIVCIENKFSNEEEMVFTTAILDLAASATVEFCIRTTDNNTPDITVQCVNLNLVQIGGT